MAINVDIELSLLVDVSASVSNDEFNLQKYGYVSAFSDSTIINKITSGVIGKIAVNLIYWSSAGDQNQAVGWTLIEDSASSIAFANAINSTIRPFSGLTAPGSAINFAVPLFASNNYNGSYKVIDISSDGAQNSGADSSDARDAAYAQGININALVIGASVPGDSLYDFYYNNIIIGDNSFIIATADFSGIVDAVYQKLSLELGVIATNSCINLKAQIVSNLDHLEGETVSIIADGVVQPSQVVVGGSVNLSSEFGIIHVGLPYNCDIETNNIEVVSGSSN